MDDGDKNTNVEKNFSRKSFSNFFNVGTFLQSLRFRCGTIFSDITNRKFMESELRVVLYCGLFFWGVYLLYEAIK